MGFSSCFIRAHIWNRLFSNAEFNDQGQPLSNYGALGVISAKYKFSGVIDSLRPGWRIAFFYLVTFLILICNLWLITRDLVNVLYVYSLLHWSCVRVFDETAQVRNVPVRWIRHCSEQPLSNFLLGPTLSFAAIFLLWALRILNLLGQVLRSTALRELVLILCSPTEAMPCLTTCAQRRCN